MALEPAFYDLIWSRDFSRIRVSHETSALPAWCSLEAVLSLG